MRTILLNLRQLYYYYYCNLKNCLFSQIHTILWKLQQFIIIIIIIIAI